VADIAAILVMSQSAGSGSGGAKAAAADNDLLVTQSLAPSHILQDGRFVRLPPPSAADRRRYFERAINEHGLLIEDMGLRQRQRQQKKKEELEGQEPAKDDGSEGGGSEQQETGGKKKSKKRSEPKVHPLALASARLQADGINELNRAINLAGLVTSQEYFGMSNIVDPAALELMTTAKEATAAAASASSKSKSSSGEKRDLAGGGGGGKAPGASAASASSIEASSELLTDQRVKASYVLKRKRAQFQKASSTLARHRRRLAEAIVTQKLPDERLKQLRPLGWRLTAPEHGTKALPHAPRPTEVVAVDVDVYSKLGTALGRLTRRIARYATLEVRDDYRVQADLEKWNKTVYEKLVKKDDDNDNDDGGRGRADDAMDVDEEDETTESAKDDGPKDKSEDDKDQTESKPGNEDEKESVWTIAEPFVIADPTLGSTEFDPKNPMLSLRFDIEKSSTSFRQSAVLEPVSSTLVQHDDEKVLFALQHSLFCAKLFESIRRELAPDTEEVGNVRTTAEAQSVVWLSGSRAETNFLPPPSYTMSGAGGAGGLIPLCVIHCHEGEVKVQLDCEYTLCVKLVEAGFDDDTNATAKTNGSPDNGTTSSQNGNEDSGSQSPEHLLALCRALLLHAQERYHVHSVRAAERARKRLERDEAAAAAAATTVLQNPHGAHRRRDETTASPRILQSCVSLGAKLLFERRIRETLRRVGRWLDGQRTRQNGEDGNGETQRLDVAWLPVSVFDLHAAFTLTFRDWVADVHLEPERLTVTSIHTSPAAEDGGGGGGGESYTQKKVKFHSDAQFELYLKLKLERMLASSRRAD